MDRPLDGARNHGAIRVLDGGVVDDAMNQQGPVLHQAEHGVLSVFSSAARILGLMKLGTM